MVSCSLHKNLAYDFVQKSKGASVAFYIPEKLEKNNQRSDCNPKSVELVTLDESQLRDTINARTKIVNKIDDEIFFNVMIASFEETLKDYDLNLLYWEEDGKMPDSLHWIVDLSHIEVTEIVKHQITHCGVEGNYEILPATAVNVASWFDLSNGEKSTLLFTEQDYEDYLVDCYYTLDTANNLIVNADYQIISLDGFYDFAVILGRLYAGYCYDFFMNEYVRNEMIKKENYYDENEMYLRYDPYESFIYGTYRDRLLKVEN